MADHEIEFPHLPTFQFAPETQEAMEAIENRRAQHLDDFLIQVARRIQMIDNDVAGWIEKLEIQKRQYVVVFEIGLVEKVLDVADVRQPGSTRLTPNLLLARD